MESRDPARAVEIEPSVRPLITVKSRLTRRLAELGASANYMRGSTSGIGDQGLGIRDAIGKTRSGVSSRHDASDFRPGFVSVCRQRGLRSSACYAHAIHLR